MKILEQVEIDIQAEHFFKVQTLIAAEICGHASL